MDKKKIVIVNLIIIFLITSFVLLIVHRYQKDNAKISKKDYQNKYQNIQNGSKNNINSFTKEEVANHNSEKDCWLIIDNIIYDVTKYINQHPGGSDKIIVFCGKDGTQAFATRGEKNQPHPPSAYKKLEEFKIGRLKK